MKLSCQLWDKLPSNNSLLFLKKQVLNRIIRFRLTDEENLERAFQALDKAGTAYVSPELLEAKLRRMGLPKLM